VILEEADDSSEAEIELNPDDIDNGSAIDSNTSENRSEVRVLEIVV
jgi:hypothetical protein